MTFENFSFYFPPKGAEITFSYRGDLLLPAADRLAGPPLEHAELPVVVVERSSCGLSLVLPRPKDYLCIYLFLGHLCLCLCLCLL